MMKLISLFARMIPEGPIKNWVRTTILNYRIGAPRELMVNRGDTVVQVGMWRPESAKRLANSVGPNGTILFVEVSEASIATLKETMKDSPCKNVHFVNKGAWDSPGELELLLEDDPASTRLQTGMLHPGHGQSETKIVPVDTIKNICHDVGIKSIDYIEITVNGAELNALKGMGELIHSTKRFWIAGLTRDAETGRPLNLDLAAYFDKLGLKSKISHSGQKVNPEWGRLDGHVYAWQ